MEDNFNANNLSMSQINAYSNAKETFQKPRNYLSIFAMVFMIIVVLILVGFSVINFGKFAQQESSKVVNAQGAHNKDVEKLTNQ